MAPLTRSKSSTGAIAMCCMSPASTPAAISRRERRKARQESFSNYNYRVLKKHHPDLSISKTGMTVMNDMMQDVFDRVANLADRLTKVNRSVTLGEREIRGSVQLMLPKGSLVQNAQNKAQKALENYRSHQN